MTDREVSLRISTTADGDEQVRALALELDRLAQEGGESSAAAAALSARLKELGNQQGVIGQFVELKRSTTEAEAAFKAATSATAEAAATLRQRKAALEEARAAEAAANQELAEAKAKMDAVGLTTKTATAALQPFREAARQAGKEAREAAGAVSQANKAFEASKRDAGSAKAEYLKGRDALNEVRKSAEAAGVSTGNLAKSQIAAKNAVAQLAGEAAKLKQESQSAGLSMQQAFGAVGVRSAIEIRAELDRVNVAMLTLKQSGKLAGADLERALAAGRAKAAELRNELAGVEKGAGGLMTALRPLAAAISGAFVFEQFARTNADLENLERTFTVLTGSAEGARRELDYVRDVSDRLGINALAAAKAYGQLSASTKGTGVEGQKTRDVFEAVARSMSVAGKSAADTEGALQALSQIASKGQVQMEELRGQLGERLPGALKAVADGFGITTDQLIALVESGRLTADELFPALTKGLNDLYGAQAAGAKQAETLTQELEHFKNTAADVFKMLGDAGGSSLMKTSLEALGAAGVVTSNVIVTLGQTVGAFAAAVANGDIGLRGFNDTARAAFAQIEEEARAKLVKAAMHNEVLAASLDAAGKKALEAARQQGAAGDAAQQGGQAAAAAVGDWTRLNVAYATIEKAVKDSVKLAEESVAARKAEGETALAVANAFGTEANQITANTQATGANSAAMSALAERKKELYAVAQANLLALQQEVAANGTATAAQQKVLDELVKTVAIRKEDAAQAIAQADAAKIAAAAAQVEAQTYFDNSQRLDELRAAYERATAALNALREAKAAGMEVTQQLAAAEIEAGKAAVLYRDALADQLEIMQAANTVKQAEADLAAAGIRLAIQQQRGILDVARAKGDEYGATQALLEIKRLEIKLAEITAQAKKAEADAALAVVAAKREELAANGELTVAKEKELQAQELAAKAKQVEAQIAAESAKTMRELAEATQMSAQAASIASGNYDGLADSLGRVANSAGSAASGMQSAASSAAAAPGAAGGGGSPEATYSWDTSQQGLMKYIHNAGADAEQANAAAPYIKAAFDRRMSQIKSLNSVRNLGDLIDDFGKQAANEALQIAASKAYQDRQKESEKTLATPGFSIDIRLGGGKPTRVNTATKGDADALAGVFRLLEADAERAF